MAFFYSVTYSMPCFRARFAKRSFLISQPKFGLSGPGGRTGEADAARDREAPAEPPCFVGQFLLGRSVEVGVLTALDQGNKFLNAGRHVG